MKQILNKYKVKGCFKLRNNQRLSQVCNAPKNNGGLYLVYELQDGVIIGLIYIGCSGWVNQNGVYEFRNKGMYARIVNGSRFKGKEKKTWLLKMKEEGIDEIQVDWYVTYNASTIHIPACVEARLMQAYYDEFKVLPKWNVEY